MRIFVATSLLLAGCQTSYQCEVLPAEEIGWDDAIGDLSSPAELADGTRDDLDGLNLRLISELRPALAARLIPLEAAAPTCDPIRVLLETASTIGFRPGAFDAPPAAPAAPQRAALLAWLHEHVSDEARRVCVLRACDGLDDLAAAPDVFPPDKFNAGVLVIRPSPETHARLLELAPTAPSYDGGDTGFLNHCFPGWFAGRDRLHRLPFAYNAQRTMHWLTRAAPGYWDAVGEIRVLHFSSSPKPWEAPDRKGDLELVWWEVFLSSQVAGLGVGVAGGAFGGF